MTEPADPNPADADPVAEPAVEPPPHALGLTAFTIAGRQAPGLFVVGWLATLVGAGLIGIVAFGITGLAGGVLFLFGLLGASVGLVLLGGSQTIERRAARAAYAGPSPVLVFLAVLAMSRLTGFVIGLPLSLIGPSIPVPLGDLIGEVLQAAVFLGVVALMVVGPGALPWREMGLSRWSADAARGLLGGAVFAGPVILLTSVVGLVAVQIAGVAPESPLPPTGTTLGLALHLVAGAAIAPFAEEVLFRGFALSAWRRSGSTTRAIVLSSVFFVLGHVLFVGGDSFRESAALAFVGGVVRVPIAFTLGWLYVRTGSLWGPIGLHAAFNGILIILGELTVPH
ncbi:MAG TPA: type II CAAX endopeptidase family protein [Candidatus Dormibacteraeota bacterium]|nr:type II CAAX endopeptidase family protein [Candidatus Dormibacteraeota bacterium]